MLRYLQQKRLFHIITALVTTFAFLSYYAMATGDGITSHPYVSGRSKHGAVTEITERDVYWARYVDVSTRKSFKPSTTYLGMS